MTTPTPDTWREFNAETDDFRDLDVNWPTLREAASLLGLSHIQTRILTSNEQGRFNCYGPIYPPRLIEERRFRVPSHPGLPISSTGEVSRCSCVDCIRVSRESLDQLLIWLATQTGKGQP